MSSLKTLKTRIKTIKSTQKITKAMKMVATAKLRASTEKSIAFRPYAKKVEEVLNIMLCASVDEINAPKLLVGNGKEEVHLLIVSTSDKGLCGAFNLNIIKKVRKDISELQAAHKKVKLFCIGAKGHEMLRKKYGADIVWHRRGFGNRGPTFHDILELTAVLLDFFDQGVFDVCKIYYSKFVSIINQQPWVKKIMPFEKDNGSSDQNNYEFEPSEGEILEATLAKNLSVQIYQALLENVASENAARMTAMENATRNSGEVIKKLQLVYNRTRQAYITKELIEIIAGAEAV